MHSKNIPRFSTIIAIAIITLSFAIKNNSTGQLTGSLGTVRVQGGFVSGGTDETSHVNYFKGIPFAAPPTGNLRWKAPQPVHPWTGTKSCISFGASPMQATPAPFSMWSEEFLIPKQPISEDCLYLNVWTPAKTGNEKLPVIVWIYGGGFASGGGNVPIYDGEATAKKGIVFVSFNYRVGIFGFFAHPDLTQESAEHVSGNYGLMDQVAALQWVQRNIAAFGGDASKVTIAGQSAGSMSVVALIASPRAKGLFRNAIAESGAGLMSTSPANAAEPMRTRAGAEQDGVKVAAKLGAKTIADLRQLPADILLRAGFRGEPIVDGYVLPESTASIFMQHKENPVSLLTGWNQEEGIMFQPALSAAKYTEQLTEEYGDKAAGLLKYYPATNDSVAMHSQLELARDLVFGAQNYLLANLESAYARPVYVYRFTHKVPGNGQYAKFGAFHTGEVPYAYDNLGFSDRPWQAVDRQLATNMAAYFANFVKTGNPNGSGLPDWPRYQMGSKKIIQLDAELRTTSMPDTAALNLVCHILSPHN